MMNELINKVIKDLEKSGFSAELRARQVFIDSGWSVSAGYGYIDKDTDKSREIDILASKNLNLKSGEEIYTYTEFHVCGEVKKSEKPWVVFDQYSHPLLLPCAWNNLISAINLPVKPKYFAKTLKKNSPIRNNGWIGSGIHESFKNPDQQSRWYGSFVSVSKASEFYHDSISPDGEKVTKDIVNNPCEIHFIQPLIILDASLFRARLSNKGEIEVEDINNAAFKFDYPSKHYKKSPYRVDVVKLEHLGNYLKIIEKRQKELCLEIEKHAGLAL
jgi:hypothetical protein